MAYNFTKGPQKLDDIVASMDPEKDTKIDFGDNKIDFIIGGVKVVSLTPTLFSASFMQGNGSQITNITSNNSLDPTLQAIANITSSADRYIYFTGIDTVATGTVTSFARTLLDDANAAAALTTIGAQAFDATLNTIANLTTAADRYIYFTGVDTAATGTITAFGRSLIDDASNANARITLGMGDIATQNSGTISLVGGNINNVVIGNTVQSIGKFTSLSASTTLEVGTNLTVSNALYCYNDIIASGTTATINVIRSSSLNHPLMTIENRHTDGDAALRFESGPDGITLDSDSYVMGVDGSDNQKFKISYSASKGDGATGALLGTNDIMIFNGNTDITIEPASLFNNKATFVGGMALGTSVSQRITTGGGFESLLPYVSNNHSFGSSTNKWANLYHFGTYWFDNADNVWHTKMSGTDLHFYYGTNNIPTTASKGFLDSATSVSNIDFTGQHRNIVASTEQLNDYKNHVGLIVVSDGTYVNSDLTSKPSINESLPRIKLSSQRNQKSVWGVVSDSEDINDSTRSYAIGRFVSVLDKQTIEQDTRIIVNSIGEGAVWICNVNGNLQNGDYITTCEVPGLGMKQDSEFLANYTVAKITQDCDFELNNPNYDCVEFVHNGVTYRKAFVGCTYHCG